VHYCSCIKYLIPYFCVVRTLITNIKKLLQVQDNSNTTHIVAGLAMKSLPSISDAYLIIEDGLIKEFGTQNDFKTEQYFDKTIHANGGLVLPSYIDSHTHLVHATTREGEFVDRINGLSYEQIAANGGGILNSAAKVQMMSESELFDKALQRLHHAIALGTGAIEIKSGYGLTTEAEIKMLRVIKKLKEQSPIPIKATFLGAHAYPLAYKQNHQGYIDLICEDMLPQIAAEGLADYIDVFCERGFFSVEETSQILNAGAKFNLKPKIHANQLHISGGVQVGIKHNAISVDHLESMGEEEIACLLHSTTMPVLLPGAAYFLNMHYQPARRMIDAGLPIVLASDYNPGSCPSFNMNFVISLACTQMKMTPQEAIHATTINAAAAVELQNDYGSIQVGKKASLIITQPARDEALIPYNFGTSIIKEVIV
jgi:imidazolonepropionase